MAKMSELTLAEALRQMKDALVYENGDPDPNGCKCACCCAERLVAAVEAEMSARRHEADMLLGLADLQRHGGD